MSVTLLEGRYRLERELGRDSDQITYAATDERLARPVAVRLLSPERAADPAYLAASQQAIARAGALTHPHIVPVYDSNLTGATPFVVEALVEGPSLADLLAAGHRLAPAETTRIARQAAGALAAAHAAGLVHGCLSPERIFLDSTGEVRIADFARPAPTHPTLSELRCQPPEQTLGAPPDARSDIYSLAVVLYHLIDGQPPFDGPDAAAVNLSKLAGQPRPLATVAPDLPPAMLAAIEGALHSNPTERPANGSAFRDLLDQAPPLAAFSPDLDPTVALAQTQVLQRLDQTALPPLADLDPPAPRRAPPPLPEPEPGGGLMPWVGLLIVVLVVGGLYWALRNPNAKPPDLSVVPSVIGKTEAQAMQEIRAAGFQVTVSGRQNSDTVKGGDVIDQLPQPGGKPPEDKLVQLTVSLGPRFVAVPAVTGLTEAEARKALPKFGLRAVVEVARDPSHGDGVVVAQAPAAGQRVDKGSQVTLFVNRLPQEATATPEEPTASTAPPEGQPAEGSVVDQVVDQAVDTAKEKAGEAIQETGDKLKEQGKDWVDRQKEAAREAVKDAREKAAKAVEDRLRGKDAKPEPTQP